MIPAFKSEQEIRVACVKISLVNIAKSALSYSCVCRRTKSTDLKAGKLSHRCHDWLNLTCCEKLHNVAVWETLNFAYKLKTLKYNWGQNKGITNWFIYKKNIHGEIPILSAKQWQYTYCLCPWGKKIILKVLHLLTSRFLMTSASFPQLLIYTALSNTNNTWQKKLFL